ncbi:hypothetical protein ACLKA6_018720 [Drosophila palustris]
MRLMKSAWTTFGPLSWPNPQEQHTIHSSRGGSNRTKDQGPRSSLHEEKQLQQKDDTEQKALPVAYCCCC